jgi:hypothetical protein
VVYCDVWFLGVVFLKICRNPHAEYPTTEQPIIQHIKDLEKLLTATPKDLAAITVRMDGCRLHGLSARADYGRNILMSLEL